MVKHVISEGLLWHKDRGELNKDGSTTDGSFSAEQAVETVFHHSYNFRTDELGINLDFNLNDKVRGVHKGPALDEMDHLNTWPYTKQHIARLLGQCYQLSGIFLDPLLVSFKIFFSQCCKLGQDWKQQIDDVDFLAEFRGFMEVIQPLYKTLLPWPRNVLPAGNSPRCIHQHSDGATYASSYTLHMASAPIGKALGTAGSECWNVDSGSAIKTHSIPLNEAVGLGMGVEATAAYVHSNAKVLFKDYKEGDILRYICGIDSACLGSTLNPNLIH